MRTLPLLSSVAVLATFLASSCASPAPSHLPAEGAIGPYSAAVGAGDLVFLSGKIGKSARGFGAEVDAAITAIELDLGRLHLSLADVVSVNVFLIDIGDYPELNAVYAKRFPQPYPARTTVAVTALPAAARVEIQVVAAKRRRS